MVVCNFVCCNSECHQFGSAAQDVSKGEYRALCVVYVHCDNGSSKSSAYPQRASSRSCHATALEIMLYRLDMAVYINKVSYEQTPCLIYGFETRR